MIPLKLQLKNFLSYGADIQTIDFSPHSLICLSGKNGHGKSALLDAITWALWGQGRKTAGVSKSDDNLIRVGQTHMMVALQFICNGQEYRVRREYTKSSGKPYVTLDVGVLDSQQNIFVPIGGKSIRSNQEALQRLIHLDFESFCNSAFLRQGQSNEFSKKTPKERKEILAAILGLDQYEAVRSLASQKVRLLTTTRVSYQAILDRMIVDLEQLKTIDERLASLQDKFKHFSTQEKALAQKEQELEQRKKQCLQLQQEYQLVQINKAQAHKMQQDMQDVLLQTVRQWRSIHAQQLKIPAYDELEQKKKVVAEQLHHQQMHMREQLTYKEQYLQKKEYKARLEIEHAQKIADHGQEYKGKIDRLKIELEHYKGQIKTCELRCAELLKEKHAQDQILATFSEKKKMIAVDPHAYEATLKQFEKRKAYYQHWIAQGNVFAQEKLNLDRKKQLSQDEDNPCCPLCEQNLSASRRRFLKDKFLKEEHFLEHRISRIKQVVSKLKTILIEQHAQIQTLESNKNELQVLNVQLDATVNRNNTIIQELDAQEKQKRMCESQIVLLKAHIADQEKEMVHAQTVFRESLEKDQDFCALIIDMQQLEKAVVACGYDAATQERLTQELALLEATIKKHEELTAQVAQQEMRMKTVGTLVKNIKELKVQIADLHAKAQSYAIADVQRDIESLEQSFIESKKVVEQSKESLIHERGALENERAKLTALGKEKLECQNNIAQVTTQVDDLQAIAAATGKDGIQALLIQDVLPDIEQEANELLAKLTDNQAQIFIESLRDLKKGGSKETLDINISDNMGIRPYEMFSGGEAFRIDFALRIALSKILARRAGTSLQTLIIDEGFGSQDEEGLAHIMDALYKIQDDFAKIIVVSHLSAMKDQFPVHFLVEKKPLGSVISVVEQG
ncbi:MAG TPA: SMC family ATPase [Candidatus Dependentiae bacterium]|nr:SMC family ATPase [Candidatus Dependentiae bacterium]